PPSGGGPIGVYGAAMSLQSVLEILRSSGEYERAEKALGAGRPAWIEGLAGTAKTGVIATAARGLERAVLLVTADEAAGEQMVQDLPAFGFPAHRVGLYPASEPAIVEALPDAKVAASSEAPEQRALARSRMAVLEGLADRRLDIVVAPVQAALRATIGPLA